MNTHIKTYLFTCGECVQFSLGMTIASKLNIIPASNVSYSKHIIVLLVLDSFLIKKNFGGSS